MFSGLHFGRGARPAAHRFRPFASVQRNDQRNRSPLLSQHRRQAPDLCRQGSAPALSGARRRVDQRILSQRIFIVAALGHTVGSAAQNPGIRRFAHIPPRLRHRIRLFSAYATSPFARNETRFRLVFRRSGQRNDRIRRGRGAGTHSRNQRTPGAERGRSRGIATRPSLHRSTDRRSRYQRCGRTLPHVYLACRIPYFAPAGQCGSQTYSDRI